MQGDNHPEKRALAEAREATVAGLADAFAHDELSLEAFEQRVADAYACTTTTELARLTDDIGDRAGAATALALRSETAVIVEPAARPLALVAPPRRIVAVLSNVERHGAMQPGEDTRLVSVLGNLEIDYRETVFPTGITRLHVRAVLGNVEIVVPADLHVTCEGAGLLGSFDMRVKPWGQVDPNAPRLHIVGSAILGSIAIRARPPARVEALVKRLRAGTPVRPPTT